jgi:hypothetical protein
LRDPEPAAAQPYGHRYAHRTVLSPGDAVAPLAEAAATIRVSEILGC